MEITKEIVQRVVDVVDKGLVAGLGLPIPGGMCVEAAVCYALGLPHSDDPQCVAPSLRSLQVALNDAPWPSRAARAEGMRRLAVLQLGSLGHLDEIAFAREVALRTVQRILPPVLHLVGLHQEADRCESAADLAAAEAAAAAAAAVQAAVAAAAAAAAARAAAAVEVSKAAWAAAWAASRMTGAGVAGADAARAAAADGPAALPLFAALVEEVLIEMGVPGVQWLPLVDGPEAP